jgi:hypothetical protein
VGQEGLADVEIGVSEAVSIKREGMSGNQRDDIFINLGETKILY